MEKSYIWSLPIRVFHFLFAFFTLITFLINSNTLLYYHAVIGYSILILLIFRLGWGLFGPKYSLFKDFPMSKNNINEFIYDVFFENNQRYIGHNPLSSYIMISIFIVTLLTIISGGLAYGIQDGQEIFSINNPILEEIKLFERAHEFLADFLIALITIHVIGIIVERLLHKKYEAFSSIFTGYKMTSEKMSIKLTNFQKIFATFMFTIFIIFLIFNIYTPNNILISSKYNQVNYKIENITFINERASCYTLYFTEFTI